MSNFKLTDEIIRLSEYKIWEIAKKEWVWESTYVIDPDEDPEQCLCGHYPIRECCIVVNKKNGNKAIVGNCCINKFMEPKSDLIFNSIKRVSKDISNAFNLATLDYAKSKKIINDWEYNFYAGTMRKRNLTEKMRKKRIQINKLILYALRKKRTMTVNQ